MLLVKVHAEGYCTMNFVEDSAIDPATGWLAEDIDKARGPYVDIFVAENPANEKKTRQLSAGNTYLMAAQ